MDLALFIPMVLFVCIAYAVKVIVDARVRRRMVETNGSEELVKTLMESDEQSRRVSALKWGMVLTSIGVAFFIQQVAKLSEDDPATYGLLFIAAGVGLLGYHAVAGKKR